MITEQDLEQAIAECQGERNPDANTCKRLAAFYIIKNELYGKSPQYSAYSMAAAPAIPVENTTIDYHSDSEFAKAITGKNTNDILAILDDMMSALEVINPRMYACVMRKIRK